MPRCFLPLSLGLMAVMFGGFSVPLNAAQGPAESQEARIAELIEQLGHDEFSVRQRAQEELTKLGFAAFDALSAAENHEDLEIALRARYLIQSIQVDLVNENDPPEIKQLLKGYDQLEMTERLAKVELLTYEPRSESLGVLCRLVRFEKSPLVSKQAALVVLEQRWPADETLLARRTKTILGALEQSTRPGAKWLRTLAISSTDLEAAAREWPRLIDEELAASDPAQNSEQFVVALLRRHAEVLARLNRRDEAFAATRRIVTLTKGDDRRKLIDLLQWLTDQQSWELVDEIANRFAAQLTEDVPLLYTLAEARKAQGDTRQAEALAKQAYDLKRELMVEHETAARLLQVRGLVDWAKREYRGLMEHPPTRPETVRARLEFAEMLHDLLEEKEAAEVLKTLIDALGKEDPTTLQLIQRLKREVPSIRSRMHFFWAKHYESVGDRTKQAEHLEAALAQDRTDADALIAMYQLTKSDPEQSKRIVKMIREAAERFRDSIEEAPEHPETANSYNQYAWLIGNTEGDFDTAIRYSHKSLELSPGQAGFLDTLAHCYFAKGDSENAVMYQSKAIELEPHSGQLRRALDRFQAALEKSKPKPKPLSGG